MSRLKRSVNAEVDLGIDSFIDVMCNTIGVLTIMLLFAAVVASRSSRFLVRPRWEPFAEKTVHNFEAVGDRVYFVDHFALMEKVAKAVRELRHLSEEERLDAMAKLDISHGCYKVVANSLSAGVVNIVHNGTYGGTPVEDLISPNSEFGRMLASLDPEKDMVLFIVRVDGWETFQAAKAAARDVWGFDVAFEIREQDSPMNFVLGSTTAGGAYR